MIFLKPPAGLPTHPPILQWLLHSEKTGFLVQFKNMIYGQWTQ